MTNRTTKGTMTRNRPSRAVTEAQKQAREAEEREREMGRSLGWPRIEAPDRADFRPHNLYFRPNPGPLPSR